MGCCQGFPVAQYLPHLPDVVLVVRACAGVCVVVPPLEQLAMVEGHLLDVRRLLLDVVERERRYKAEWDFEEHRCDSGRCHQRVREGGGWESAAATALYCYVVVSGLSLHPTQVQQ
jgi:hypothetical protein